MRFVVLGPYRVPLNQERRIDCVAATKAVFANAADDKIVDDLGIDIDNAIGCYVFGLSPSGGARTLPYYVGQACKQTLKQRAFQGTDKPGLYQSILDESGYKKASPFLYLLPLLTATNRLAKIGTNASKITDAEYTLIGMARVSNEDLWNNKHRAGMDSFRIDGVFNERGGGRKRKAVSGFATMMGVK